MSRARMLKVFKPKPTALMVYKAPQRAMVAMPSPRLLEVESTFLRRIYAGFLKISQLFQPASKNNAFNVGFQSFGMAGNVVANAILENQAKHKRVLGAIPAKAGIQQSTKTDSSHEQETREEEYRRAVVFPATVDNDNTAAAPADEDDKASSVKTKTKTIIEKIETITIKPVVPAAPPAVKKEEKPAATVTTQVTIDTEKVVDDKDARQYLLARLNEARQRADVLNTRRLWNGRRKAKKILSAVDAVEQYLNQKDRPFITNPNGILECKFIGHAKYSVTESLAWHRHRLFAKIKPNRKTTSDVLFAVNYKKF